MARQLRIQFPGALYHITHRGNERKSIFLDNKDKEIFLDLLSFVIERFGWRCHAYVLMPNHYHFLIETPKANLSGGMKKNGGLAKLKCVDRTGEMWYHLLWIFT